MRQTVRTKDRIEFHILAKKVAKLRKGRKMSKRGLSAAVGRDRNFIYSVEKGVIHPDLATIFDICDTLDADPIEVLREVRTEAIKSKPQL